MDRRDYYNHFPRRDELDVKRMVLRVELYNEETDEDEEIELPARFEVCGTCDGKGVHVNPSIDAHGLSREDFDADPDFREDYFSGRYDVACAECGGQRVVPEVDGDRVPPEIKARLEQRARDLADLAREREYEVRYGY